MKRIFIDTDILIDFLRKRQEARKIPEDVSSQKAIGLISVITEAELHSGSECNQPEKRQAVENLLLIMRKVEVTSEIAKKAGEFRRLYSVPLLDSLIAASAVLTKCPLLTRNTTHFSRITELDLQVPY